MVNHDRMDPEALAALLDGSLSGDEREVALRRLARSPDDFEAFAEAARVLRELEAETEAAPAGPAPAPLPASAPARPEIRPARWFARPRVWVPLAALLAGALLLPPLMRDRGGAAGSLALLDGETLVAVPGPGSLERALGAGWDRPGWRVTRGGGDAQRDGRLEFRAGVRMAQVEAAFEAGDTEAVLRLRPELTGLLVRIDAPSDPVERYETVPAAPEGSREAWESSRERAASDVATSLRGSPWFDLGVWVEQARLAALAGRTAYFDDEAAALLGDLVSRADSEGGGDAPPAGRLRRLHGLVQDGVPADELGDVRSVIDEVMRESG